MQWVVAIAEQGTVDLIGNEDEIELEIIATLRRVGITLFLDGAHFSKNAGGRLGWHQLQKFATDLLRQHGQGAKRLVIQGAIRTTGANLGAAPRPMTIVLE